MKKCWHRERAFRLIRSIFRMRAIKVVGKVEAKGGRKTRLSGRYIDILA